MQPMRPRFDVGDEVVRSSASEGSVKFNGPVVRVVQPHEINDLIDSEPIGLPPDYEVVFHRRDPDWRSKCLYVVQRWPMTELSYEEACQLRPDLTKEQYEFLLTLTPNEYEGITGRASVCFIALDIDLMEAH